MRACFYTHFALVLGIALPACFDGFEQLPFFIQCIAAVSTVSLAISWAFPVLLFFLTLRRKNKWGLAVVPIDILLVWIHFKAVMPLVS
jgi:hypothetical protein